MIHRNMDREEVNRAASEAITMNTMEGPPAPVTFTEREWLALFPSFPNVPRSLSGEAPPTDPAAELRKKEPMTKERMLKAVEPWPAIRAAALPGFYLLRPLTVTTYMVAITALRLLLLIPITIAMFHFEQDMALFGSTQLVGGTVGIFVVAVWLFLFYLVFLLWEKRNLASIDNPLGHNWSVLVQWLELVKEAEGDAGRQDELKPDPTARSGLLDHSDTDCDNGLCPCPLTTCAGSLPARSAWAAFLWSVAISCATVVFFYGCIITPSLTTFATPFWATWWTALAGVLYIITIAAFSLVAELHRIHMGNTGVLDLTLRLHRRAVSLALRQALEQARFGLMSGTLPEPDSLHIELHRMLAYTWSNRMSVQGAFRKFFASSPVALFVTAVIYVVSCSLRYLIELESLTSVRFAFCTRQ